MRPSIGGEYLETFRQAPLKLKLKRVVIGSSGVRHQGCFANAGIRRKDLRRLQKPASSRADVRDRQRLVLPQALLKCSIPLERIRKLEVRIECRQSPWIYGSGRFYRKWCRGRHTQRESASAVERRRASEGISSSKNDITRF